MKFKTIYADCPWLYDNYGTQRSRGMARSAYECMPLEDICNLPVRDVADEDCMLLLWATMPKLREALQVIEAWGFKYITCGFVWVKLNPSGVGIYSGLGHWVNGNAELVLLGRKGKPIRKAFNIKQIVMEEEVLLAPRGRHSQKPYEVRHRIELLFEPPYLELFARGDRDGWVCLGNEINGDIYQSLYEVSEQ